MAPRTRRSAKDRAKEELEKAQARLTKLEQRMARLTTELEEANARHMEVEREVAYLAAHPALADEGRITKVTERLDAAERPTGNSTGPHIHFESEPVEPFAHAGPGAEPVEEGTDVGTPFDPFAEDDDEPEPRAPGEAGPFTERVRPAGS